MTETTSTEAVQPPVYKPRNKALHIIATIISYICHPVLLPVVLTIMLYKLAPLSFAGVSDAQFQRWLAIIALTTVGYPLLFVFLLRRLGMIESMLMKDRKDRLIPLVGIMIFYFWINEVVANTKMPELLHVMTLGSFWGIILVFMVSIFFKVSMHTSAAGGMLGLLLMLLLSGPINLAPAFLISLVVAGIIGTARMILRAHTPFEIWLGYGLGFVSMVAAWFYV